MTEKKYPFNVRIYALIINNKNEILLSDEYYNNVYMTKFPGGGLEFGEGTIACLQREAIEEFGQEITVLQHVYTTDFFQASLFNPRSQVMAIYYHANFVQPPQFATSTTPFDFKQVENGAISFRWHSLSPTLIDQLTLPIDKRAAQVFIDTIVTKT